MLRDAYGLYSAGKADQSAQVLRRILFANRDNHFAAHLLGLIEAGKGNLAQARELLERSLAIQPPNPEFIDNYAAVLFTAQSYASAVEVCGRGLKLDKGRATLLYIRAISLFKTDALREALADFDVLVRLNPANHLWVNERGSVLAALEAHELALSCFQKAISLKPDYAEAHYNLGKVLHHLHRRQDALASYTCAAALKPDYADVFNNRGFTLLTMKRFDEALANFAQAIRLKPDHAEAHCNSALALSFLNRGSEALASFEKARALRPDFDFLLGHIMFLRQKMCDWSHFAQDVGQSIALVEAKARAALSFVILSISDSEALNLQAARNYVAFVTARFAPPQPFAPRGRRDKIRVGYFSADFHNHATAYLMAELFERHDKSRFEMIAFSFGPASQHPMRQRLVAAFDEFIDVSELSAQRIAELSREREIDIAIDLKGFTEDNRFEIFAHRAAPIQVNYIGYPGSMGADCMDYVIADKMLIPPSHQDDYAEKVIYLPDSYQPNDSHRRIAERVFTRAECGLPERGFVFCCFNNNYKFTPDVFDSWMRILQGVPSSVLWLFVDNGAASDNLRAQAARRGVAPERLVFAAKTDLADHLARHRLADLFLDTLPYNAHTTASDALWAGLPVLTRVGETFAGRVAASLLNAVGLPELMTTSQADYEALAIALAHDPDRLSAIKQKLARNRVSSPLFDAARYARHLERAYEAVHERHHAGLPPDHIAVEALG